MLSMKNHVREALLTAALFGSVGTTVASTPENSRGVTSVPSPKVAGHGIDEPVGPQAAAAAVFTNAQGGVTQGEAG